MRVLCVGAHPDDEVLGVGGTLARHAADGDRTEVLLMGDGEITRHETETAEAKRRREQRRENARIAGDLLGVKGVTKLDYWGNQLDDVALIDVVRDVEAMVAEFRPDDEIRAQPHSRSFENIRNNARIWGEKYGLSTAEPFELLLKRR